MRWSSNDTSCRRGFPPDFCWHRDRPTKAEAQFLLGAGQFTAIAHFNFACIHPFGDGNGRIARAIAKKVPAQAIGRPTLDCAGRVPDREDASAGPSERAVERVAGAGGV